MKKYILLLLLAVCTQLSADTLNKETLFKGTAMLNGKAIPMWFNVTGNATVEIGNGKNAAISQYAEGKLVVPSNIVNPADNSSYKVTKVANFAFSLCSKLTEVTLEEGIKEIGEQVFSGCNSLASVRYPASLTTIGRGAFMGCKQLRHALLPENLATIGQESFVENQFADSKMQLPWRITTIPVAAFQDCKLQIVVLSPSLISVEEDAFLRAGACDFYMFDRNIAPIVHDKGISVASHWFATKPQNYDKKSFCNGLLPISAMVPQDEFTAENITYKIEQAGQYPGVFTASAYKKSDEMAWTSEFSALKESVLNPTFPGKWKPEFRVNGIKSTFFAGAEIVKLHHIALPASIDASLAKNAFAQCKALVSLDLSAMKPLSEGESSAILGGIAENTIVYAPKGQALSYRDCNVVLTKDNGQRHTRHFKIHLDDSFDALTLEASLAYKLPYSFMAERATFYRSSFKNKQKETLVLPFAAKPQGKAYAFAGMKKQSGTETVATFAKKDELLANTPYIYESDGTEISAENVEVNPKVAESKPLEKDNLYAVYKADLIKKLAEEKLLNGIVYTFNADGTAGGTTFVQASDDAKITPFHAFFHLSDKNAGVNLKPLFEGEASTGIQKISTEAANEDNTWFNLQGVRFNTKPQKGVYIHKGKKLMVR